jgi:hypothetical protein
MNWDQSKSSSLVYPATPPGPIPYKPREYILICPRCQRPITVGEEHESMYTFDCSCGGGVVAVGGHIMGGDCSDVRSIAWNEMRPFLGAKPL